MTICLSRNDITFKETCFDLANGKVTVEEIVSFHEDGMIVSWYPCIDGKAVRIDEGDAHYPYKEEAIKAAWRVQEIAREHGAGLLGLGG